MSNKNDCSDTSKVDKKIKWDDQGQPFSTQFDDIYFSKINGLEESSYVFLHHNNLKERFRSLNKHDAFTIGETGFGTGLNFLNCWALWDKTADSSCRLTYISAEKYPLSPEELTQSLTLWPELEPYIQQFSVCYRENYIGARRPHVQYFDFGNMRLHLIINDAAEGFKQLLASQHPGFSTPYWCKPIEGNSKSTLRGVNAWFLDGFAPSKNPEMWSKSLIETLSTLSAPNASFSTFTAAGIAKQNLSSAGFSIKKVPGFANKREMLIGQLIGKPNNNTPSTINHSNIKDATPWHVSKNYRAVPNKQSVAIVGAGLAGCHSAHALAKRGFSVTLIDKHPHIAYEASGNPQGVLYAKLSADDRGTLGQFNLASLLYAQQFYKAFWQEHPNAGQRCGVLQLAYNSSSQKNHKAITESLPYSECIQQTDSHTASTVANITIGYPALYFPYCGWMEPAVLCQWLSKHPNITIQRETQVTELHQHKLHQQGASSAWELKAKLKAGVKETLWIQKFDHVILANANDAAQLTQTNWLPTKAIRGQVSYLKVQNASEKLKSVICARGYIAPASTISGHKAHAIGATFNLHEQSPELSDNDHDDNISNITAYLPELNTPAISDSIMGGRVGFRCTSPDYLPLVGPIPDTEKFYRDFNNLSHNARATIASSGSYLDNLYCNIAHGSRGLAYSPLSAEILASIIAGEPPPASQLQINALNPARFIIRDLIRRN
ncbi:MAG: bifunctional tRNA (5-methylaminomethyl-2-thiouridine)(34)-methyltransferase MnmD/FAD-dependent 5-carboxymethylaminomethyl-2-thiouridine(34) oxidoreductase MnmC [Cellvibrionaceae bacterium]